MKNFSKSKPCIVAWWPLDRRKKLYSSRARGFWHIDFLQKNFNDIRVKAYGKRGDILIVQKPTSLKRANQIKKVAKNFKKVIFDLSDLVPDFEKEKAEKMGLLTLKEFIEFSKIADFYVVNGIGLKHWVETVVKRPAVIIEDSYHIDYDPRIIKKHTTKKPKIVWHGSGKTAGLFLEGKLNEWDEEEFKSYKHKEHYLGDLNKTLDTKITIYSDDSYPQFRASEQTIYKPHPQYPKLFNELIEYDIGIAPYFLWNKYCQGKSSNKIDAMMVVGLPVIATPIPENKRLIEHGVNGFLCSTQKEWKAAFKALQDPKKRNEMGRAARESVIVNRSIPFLSSKWRILLMDTFADH
jgi:glycosyltransferase involved in cell wall biosynthesis